MAKKERDALGDFAEDVGRLLGTTERKASEWLSQRTIVARKLAAVRDRAQALLSKLNAGDVPSRKSPRPGAAKKRTKGKGRTSSAAQRNEKAAPEKAPRTARKRKPARKTTRKTKRASTGDGGNS